MPRTIHFLIAPHAMALDIAGPMDVFTTANGFLPDGAPHYRTETVGLGRGPVMLSSGAQLHVDHALSEDLHGNTLVVAGGADAPLRAFADEPRVRAYLQAAPARYLRVVSICNGALILARGGLLDGRRATTHWDNLRELQALAPSARVADDALYVQDENIYTSAGVAAGIDLALHLVERDCGRHVALKTARMLVVYLRRPGGQRQFSDILAAEFMSEPLVEFGEWLREHLVEPLTLDDMAAAAGMSRRNFTRVFRAQTGTTPAAYLERLRVESAANLLAGSEMSIKRIARAAGFGSEQGLRRSFRREYGVAPTEFRIRFGTTGETP